MIVDVNQLLQIREYLYTINSKNLEDIIWTVNDQPLEINEKLVEEFKFIGLSNTEFIHWFLEDVE